MHSKYFLFIYFVLRYEQNIPTFINIFASKSCSKNSTRLCYHWPLLTQPDNTNTSQENPPINLTTWVQLTTAAFCTKKCISLSWIWVLFIVDHRFLCVLGLVTQTRVAIAKSIGLFWFWAILSNRVLLFANDWHFILWGNESYLGMHLFDIGYQLVFILIFGLYTKNRYQVRRLHGLSAEPIKPIKNILF